MRMERLATICEMTTTADAEEVLLEETVRLVSESNRDDFF